MCGIVCAFDLKQASEQLRPELIEMSKSLRHRGPDWSGITVPIRRYWFMSG